MGAGEKKIAALLTIALVVLIGVYIVTGRTSAPGVPSGGNPMMQQQAMMQKGGGSGPGATAASSGGPGCSTSTPSAAGGVATQEFGKKGAKVEIVADLPITHGCHVNTEAQVKEAYKKFPNDVHLVIYDLFGPDGGKFAQSHGGRRAMVVINGKTSFDLNGKKVTFEYTEDRYNVNDIVPVVEQEVKGAKTS